MSAPFFIRNASSNLVEKVVDQLHVMDDALFNFDTKAKVEQQLA